MENGCQKVFSTGSVVQAIAGIIGIISLVSGPYLLVITRKARLGALFAGEGEVWKILETEIISYARYVEWWDFNKFRLLIMRS